MMVVEPVAWMRTDTPKTVITEQEYIAQGWELDGAPYEPLITIHQLKAALAAERERCENEIAGMVGCGTGWNECVDAAIDIIRALGDE